MKRNKGNQTTISIFSNLKEQNTISTWKSEEDTHLGKQISFFQNTNIVGLVHSCTGHLSQQDLGVTPQRDWLCLYPSVFCLKLFEGKKKKKAQSTLLESLQSNNISR